MKAFFCAVCFFMISGFVCALDTKSSDFIEFLLNLKEPSGPVLFDDAVIFTAPSVYKRVGVAFASENFANVHWFVKLLVPIDETVVFDPKSKIPPEFLRDSGILFYAWSPETPVSSIEYRLVIDGLWSADPLNHVRRADPVTGLELSVAPVPRRPLPRSEVVDDGKTLSLIYRTDPGEQITVAGDFNGWDPFMYQMKESAPGFYTIAIPLPAGTWRYVFFHRGKRMLDPANLDRVYSRNGMSANTIVLR